MNMLKPLLAFYVFSISGSALAQYQQPPEPLLSVMRVPLPVRPVPDPTGRTLLMLQQSAYPPIARVAEPYLKLAGVRIEPRLHARHDMANGYGIRACLDGLSLLDVKTGAETPLQLPEQACPGIPEWSPDGQRFAFTMTTEAGVELWLGEVAGAKVWKVQGVRLNPILDSTLQWLGDTPYLLVKQVPDDIGPAPLKSHVPSGPEIKDATAGGGESSTYEARDTLSSPQDEALFDYYARSRLTRVDTRDGRLEHIGAAAVIGAVEAAPDGRHVRVEVLQRPYSYVVTWTRFARQVRVLDLATGKDSLIAQLPAAETVPVQGVPTGARAFSWRANEPATLIWAEALDGGDWKVQVPQRDRLLMWRAPFKRKPVEIGRTTQRYAGLSWFERGGHALRTEYDANRRWYEVALVDMDASAKPARVLWSLSTSERYAHPGTPLTRRLRNGATVLREQDGHLFLAGYGASPGGDRPFLDRYSIADGKTERWFRSAPDAFETVLGFVGDPSTQILTLHESPQQPPNVFVRTFGPDQPKTAAGEAMRTSQRSALTHYPDPVPQVRRINKRLINYTRKDGVALSFTLYTPPDYVEGTRLPTILYAYPLDYADPAQAGQVRGSDQTFTRLLGHRLLLLAGYAVIDNAAFPIVGDPKNAYDSYLQQLVDNAEAAVAKAVELGVADPERIGVTGHSHGALMTANLLAHSDLFRAGVASAGGYNKTLTPFGFQNERRSFWAAPKAYDEASSFFHADKINEPILIVHGSDDANPGTEPTQSPRLFQAVRGLGGSARLVMLPNEPHWFTARESNEHFVAEMLAWFDRYVKNAPASGAAQDKAQ